MALSLSASLSLQCPRTSLTSRKGTPCNRVVQNGSRAASLSSSFTPSLSPLLRPRGSTLISKTPPRVPRVVAEAPTSTTPATGNYLGKLGNAKEATRVAAASNTAASQVASAVLPQHVRQNLKPANAFWPLALAILVPVLGGVIVSTFANPMQSWYQDLEKPSWVPPDWLFGAVWSALYVLMGVASFLVWADGHWVKQTAPLQLYAWQLLLNFSWPIVFFKQHQILLGSIILGVLAVLVNATMRSFYAVNRIAGWLMLPYQAWVVFAFILNLAYWRLNRNGQGPLSGASWSAAPRPGEW